MSARLCFLCLSRPLLLLLLPLLFTTPPPAGWQIGGAGAEPNRAEPSHPLVRLLPSFPGPSLTPPPLSPVEKRAALVFLCPRGRGRGCMPGSCLTQHGMRPVGPSSAQAWACQTGEQQQQEEEAHAPGPTYAKASPGYSKREVFMMDAKII